MFTCVDVNVLLEYMDLWLAKHYILCLMLPATYYAQNNASRIGRFLPMMVCIDTKCTRNLCTGEKDANILRTFKLMILFSHFSTLGVTNSSTFNHAMLSWI